MTESNEKQPENNKEKEKRKVKTDHLKEYQFKPGQSGNPNGRPRTKTVLTELERMMAEGLSGMDLREAMAKVAYKHALKGDNKFWNDVLNRLYGKVPDNVTADGKVEIVIKHVDKEPETDDGTIE